MYEQNDVPVFRRILWIALWFIVAVAIVWTVVWLIFFRGNSNTTPMATTKTPARHSTTHTSTSPSTDKPSEPSDTATTPPSAAPSASQPSAAATATPAGTSAPTELANTGAGDVMMPVAIATATGSVFYYVRLRRKLLH